MTDSISFRVWADKAHRDSLRKPYKKKPLYSCSVDERHKLTLNQAKKSGYFCTHCGAELRVRREKLRQLDQLRKELEG